MTKVTIAVAVLCGLAVVQHSKPHKNIDGNITENAWQGQSDQSSFAPSKKSDPEPPDVPAIQKTRKSCIERGNLTWGGEPPCTKWEDEKYPTCADKTRILEHDEQTPPKYWCRKVESGGTPESESK